MANRIQLIIFRYTDNAGAPLAGGKVYFYEVGTTTLKNTYTDETAETPNSNPVILDARGEADIFLSGSYKVVVYDSNDNLIETQDNVYEYPAQTIVAANKAEALTLAPLARRAIFVEGTDGGLFRSVVGAAPGTYTDNGGAYCGTIIVPTGGDGSAAFLREDLGHITLGMFGLVLNGIADDASSFQLAITAAAASNTVLIGRKAICAIGTSITIPANSQWDLKGLTIKRIAGTIYGGAATQMMKATSVSGLRLLNFTVDGNKSADSLVATVAGDRFGGLVLDSITDPATELRGVKVTGTVNAEDTAGIYLTNCSGVKLWDCWAYSNDRSGIFFSNSDSCLINGGYFYSNLGSGVTSYNADDCEYYNLKAHDNGYSQISINGLRSKGDNLAAWNGANGYSGINIGHDAANNRATGSIISNVHVYDNAGWGLTVIGSDDVTISGINASNNTNRGVYVDSNSNRSTITGVTSERNSNGVFYQSGTGHFLDNANVYDNDGTGIFVNASGVELTVGCNVKSFNNGLVTSTNSAGLLAVTGAIVTINGGEFFDNQGTPTQESGIWLAGCTATFRGGYIYGNLTFSLRQTLTPVIKNLSNLRFGSDALEGNITATATATQVITNNNSFSSQYIKIWPVNAAAVTLGQPYVSAVTAGVSFTVTYPATAAGTELYSYKLQ